MNIAVGILAEAESSDRVRLAPRVPLRASVVVAVMGRALRFEAQGHDISDGGCFVRSDVLLPVGTAVAVHFPVDAVGGVSVLAQVVRVVTHGVGTGLGLRFVGEALPAVAPERAAHVL
jgi:hypothetical protein